MHAGGDGFNRQGRLTAQAHGNLQYNSALLDSPLSQEASPQRFYRLSVSP
jgi:hypothetical protein